MWKKWYQSQGYDTTNWSASNLMNGMKMMLWIGEAKKSNNVSTRWGGCPGGEGPSPPLPDRPPTDPQVKLSFTQVSHAATQDRALQSIFFPDKEKSLETEEQKAITQEVKEEESHVKMEQASVVDGAVSAVKEEDGNPTKVEENVTLKEKTQAVKLKFDFASLPPPPPPPPPAETKWFLVNSQKVRRCAMK